MPHPTTEPLRQLTLIGLGVVVPLLYLAYLTLRVRIEPSSYPHMVTLYAFQWLPLTTLLWFVAGLTWPGGQARTVAWGMLALGLAVSGASWIVFRFVLWN